MDVDDLRIHVRHGLDRAPEGRVPLVLVHGAAVSSLHVAPTAERLSGHFPVYAPDLPGHGRSDNPSRVLDPGGHADFLARWMSVSGIERAHFLGNSFGCQVIAEFAARYPRRVDRVVLQGTTVDPSGRGFFRQLSRWLRNTWLEGATQPRVTFRQWGQAGPRVFFMTIRHMARDRIEQKLPFIAAPALVVRGSRDPIIPQHWAEEACALLGNGRLVVIPDETHTITVSNPEALTDVVVPFLLE